MIVAQDRNFLYPQDVFLRTGLCVHVADACDAVIYRDIFVDTEYAAALDRVLEPLGWPPNGGRPLQIVDLGANVGYFSLFAANRLLAELVPFQLHAFDFDGANLCEYKRRLEKQAVLWERIRLHQALLGAREGPARWLRSESHPCHRVAADEGMTAYYTDVTEMLPAGPIDLLKLDIEGSEQLFLESYPEVTARTRVAAVEIHGAWCDPDHIGELLAAGGLNQQELIRSSDDGKRTVVRWRNGQ